MAWAHIPLTASRAADWAGEIEIKGEDLRGTSFELVLSRSGQTVQIPLSVTPGNNSVLSFRLSNSLTRDYELGDWTGDLVQISESGRDSISPVVLSHVREGSVQ